MKTSVLTFSAFHGKNPPAGSTHIRVMQMLPHWDDLSLYRVGDNPDVLMFQKVYVTPDYRFPYHFKGIKILDTCDPDHFDGALVRETVDAVDAITCSTDALSAFYRQLTDKPVITIPDRFDMKDVPPPIEHTKDAKHVVWFGYRHNSGALKQAVPLIAELGLGLTVISDDDPMAWQWAPRESMEDFKTNSYTFIKYKEESFYSEMQRADFAILPAGNRPVDVFKSNNRTTKAVLAGLPVAKTASEVRDMMKAEQRREYMAKHYTATKKEYDIKLSVKQYQELIDKLQKGKH